MSSSKGKHDSRSSDDGSNLSTSRTPRKNKTTQGLLSLPKINPKDAIVSTKQGHDEQWEERRDERRDEHANSYEHRDGSEIRYDDHPILRYIQNNIIGQDLVIQTPFGPRQVVYCDYTASGRSLRFIEDFIQEKVYPTYANTHSTTGHNARQTGKFREEARDIIKQCVNAGPNDVVIFTGSGATPGIHKIIFGLDMNKAKVAADTVVFIGPYEHHSNILPWRESGAHVVRIKEDADTGMIDIDHLETQLKAFKDKRRMMLVCMSAASNVTGIITDCDVIATVAHRYGALAIFDYAGGGPYLDINMNTSKQAYKDAIVLSPHKFVGGPGTPGVVIAKRWIFRNKVPDRVGGGTVLYVSREAHKYVTHIEEREEGGTPAIVESIRAGLVFKLKQEVGTDLIDAREEDLCSRAFNVWERNPALHMLGNHRTRRVTIFSFITRHLETGRLVHHNFISTLLSDLFGIQARGGCACAGPYGADLLGLNGQAERNLLSLFIDKNQGKDKTGTPFRPLESIKPGFTRINLSYFSDDKSVDFVIKAVDMVAKHGWKLLPQYTFDPYTGSWKHKAFSKTPDSDLLGLDDVTFDVNNNGSTPHRDVTYSKEKAPSFEGVLREAEQILTDAPTTARRSRVTSASLALRELIPRERRKFRWFLTPNEAVNIMADLEEDYLERPLYKLPFTLPAPTPRTESERDSDYHSYVTDDVGKRRSGNTSQTIEDGGERYALTPDVQDEHINLLSNTSDRKTVRREPLKGDGRHAGVQKQLNRVEERRPNQRNDMIPKDKKSHQGYSSLRSDTKRKTLKNDSLEEDPYYSDY